MRHPILRNLWGTLLWLAIAAAPARAGEVPAGLADRLAPLLPAVVNIETITTRADRPFYFWGSGFVVEPSGLIVTNRHVIAGADRITVTGQDFPPTLAKVIYVSDLLDLAMLKIAAPRPLPVLHFGDSDGVRIGDAVFAVGNPLGIGRSVSAGVVSALNRVIHETSYDDFIQTDAAINHGNSGGPLVDMAGRVVGIDTALYSSPHNTGSIGLGFALPANDAAFIVDQVIRFGEVRAGWAGLHVQHMTVALAGGLGLKQPQGVVVTELVPHGPAATDGMAVGDVIAAVGGQDVTGTQQFQRVVAEAPIGQTLPLTVLRDGATRTLTLHIAADPHNTALAAPAAPLPPELRVTLATPADPGMRLATLTPAERRRYALGAAQTGVLVTEVFAGSAAAERGIVAGDVILRVRAHAVTTPADLRRELAALSRQGAEQVALLVQGKTDTHWVALKLAAAR